MTIYHLDMIRNTAKQVKKNVRFVVEFIQKLLLNSRVHIKLTDLFEILASNQHQLYEAKAPKM